MGGDPEGSRCPEASGSKGPACHRSRLVAQGRGGVGTAVGRDGCRPGLAVPGGAQVWGRT